MVLKWKQSAHSVFIVPKKTNVAKKPITKADLVEEIKVKQINDAIEEDIKSSDEIIAILKKKENTYLATIKKLEETIKTLKSTKPSKHSTFAETQTLADDEDSVLISCNLCIYVATCEEHLTWHMGMKLTTLILIFNVVFVENGADLMLI